MTDKNELLQHDETFRYMLLSRLQRDCEYYLGYGNRQDKHLWAGNVEDQIDTMITLYESFDNDKKPEWITIEEIEKYREEMLKDAERVLYDVYVYLDEDKSDLLGQLQLIKCNDMYIIKLDGHILKVGLQFDSDEEALHEVMEYIDQYMIKTKEVEE